MQMFIWDVFEEEEEEDNDREWAVARDMGSISSMHLPGAFTRTDPKSTKNCLT